MTTQSSTTPRRRHTRKDVGLSEKLVRAIQMRMQGYTYDAIAHELGYSSRATAYNAIHDELSHYAEQNIEQYRNEAMAQLDELQRRIWPQVMSGGKDGEMDLWALDRLLVIIEKRHRLLGLYPKEGASAAATVLIREIPQEVIDAI